MNNKNERKGSYSSLVGYRRAIPILLVALAVFVGVCFITESTGAVGKWVSSVLRGMFSVGAYFVPFLLLLHAFFYPSDISQKRVTTRVICSLIALIMVSAFAHTLAHFDAPVLEPRSFYADGRELIGGGFIGGLVSYLLTKAFGSVGLIIIAVLIFALYVAYFFAGGKRTIARALLLLLTAISDVFARFSDKNEKKRAEKEAEQKEAAREEEIEKQNALLNDEFFTSGNSLAELTIPELGIKEVNYERLTAPSDSETATAPEKERTTSAKKGSFDYGFDDAPTFAAIGAPTSKSEPAARSHNSYGIDEDAESVFGKDFDAFDFRINQEIASRQSSKAASESKADEGIDEIATPIHTLTEEDIEKARRRADFEMKKKAVLESQGASLPKEETIEFGEPPIEEAQEPVEEYYGQVAETVSPVEIEAEPEKIADFIEPTFDDLAPSHEEDTQTASDGDRAKESMVMNRSMLDTGLEEDNGMPAESFEQAEREGELTFEFSTDADEDAEPDTDDEVEYAPVNSESADEDADESEQDGDYYEVIPPEEQNPVINEYRKMFSFLDDEDTDGDDESETDDDLVADSVEIDEADDEVEEDEPTFDETDEVDDVPFEIPAVQEKKPEPEQEEFKKPDFSNYKFPPIDLLKQGQPEEDENADEETNKNAEKLVETLAQFSVKVTLKGYDRGPRITRYEIVPAKGVKVNQVTNLFDDIALNMEAEGIRMEAPIPGKSAIGVEIPNKKPALVLLRDLIESEEFIREESKTCAAIGKDVTGNPVFGDISKMPHVLIAGATGMGKSVCINAVLISILYKARPDEVKFIMIDPKRVEFNSYNGIPHLLVPVVTDVKQAAGALMWAVEQMEKRYDLMGALEVKKLDEYNELVRENPALGEPLPKIVIVIDELNDIMLQVRKPVEGLIMSIAQKARAAGIHLILGTQRPSVDVITGVIKSNIPSRISCKVMSFQDSKTIIDQAGAEKLLNNGDMLYFPNGSPKPLRVQGAFVSNGEVSKVMKFLKDQAKGQNVYDQKALEEINNAAKKCVKGSSSDDDDDDDGAEENSGILNDQQFLDAVDLAIKSGKISTSLIQRRIGVGYGKAAKFIDSMEDLGIVSEPNGQKPRDILITKDEWHEMLARRALD